MSALSKRQSFSFLFTLPLPFLVVVVVAFLATSFLVLEAFLAERLVACKVDCRVDSEAWMDCLADGLSMPYRRAGRAAVTDCWVVGVEASDY